MTHRTARLSRAGALLAVTLGVSFLGFGHPASAGTGDGSTVVITGGAATAINECINYAEGGDSIEQNNICYQIATAGNVLIVENVNITIYQNGRSKKSATMLDQVTASLTGGDAEAVGQCVKERSAQGKAAGHAKKAKAGKCQGVPESTGDTLVLDGVQIAVVP